MKNIFPRCVRAALFLLIPSTALLAEDFAAVKLPPPQMEGGVPLMQALKNRKSAREFNPSAKISPQTLSNLLWAGCGINRPENGHRTAPSAMNWREIDIYVATANGLYRYDPAKNELLTIAARDARALTGTQSYVARASADLVYVADSSRMGQAAGGDKNVLSAADAGFIAENVYLYCASAGLSTVVRASIDKPRLSEVLKLRPDQTIILAQSVGYPE
jgi:nitroreductase